MKKDTIEYYKEMLEYVEQCNRFHVFNYYDSEYVENLKKHIELMEKQEEYDKIPVVACKYCNLSPIVVDEDGNDVCLRCGAINEIVIYDTIYDVPDYINYKE